MSGPRDAAAALGVERGSGIDYVQRTNALTVPSRRRLFASGEASDDASKRPRRDSSTTAVDEVKAWLEVCPPGSDRLESAGSTGRKVGTRT